MIVCVADVDPGRGLVPSTAAAKVHQLHYRYPADLDTRLDSLKERLDLSHDSTARHLEHGYTEKTAPRRRAVRVFEVHDVMYGHCILSS